MAEVRLRRGVFDHLQLEARAVDDIGDAGVALCERRFVGKINLRGAPTRRFRDAVKRALGVAPPTVPNTAAAGSGEEVASVLWLGPDEWLVVTPPDAEGAVAAALEEALAGIRHVAVTDVSDGRAVIGLAGTHAREVLERGCPIDLHPRAFKAGQCAQTHFARALVLIHQTADTPAYDVYVERSVGDYLWAWFEDAAAAHGLAIVRG